MKKRLTLLLSVACLAPAAQVRAECCECDTVGRTFYTVRPLYQSASAEKITMFRDRMDARENGKGGAFQMALFGSRSTYPEGLRAYFSPTCKNKLKVKEESPYLRITQNIGEQPDDTIDIIGRHFRILTVNGLAKAKAAFPPQGNPALTTDPLFESTICFEPRQTVFGIGLTYKQNLTTLMSDEDKDYHWWFEISAPITRVKNNMELEEKTSEDGGGAVDAITGLDEDYEFFASMEDAFKQSAWNYGKIDCKCMTKWGLADIELKLGIDWITKDETCRLEGYVGFLIPTGNKPCAEYMFEPIVGHNKHFGIVKGSHACFRIWEDEQEAKAVHTTLDIHGMYLFSRHEKRSFDVKDKPWSRYMEVYEDKTQATLASTIADDAGLMLATPGINLFTSDLKVKPRLSCNLSTALIYSNDDKGFRGEVGYTCFVRQKECVELACSWHKEVAFKSERGKGKTSSLGTIKNRNEAYLHWDQPDPELKYQVSYRRLDVYDESIIKESDLDMDSASHPAAFSHTFHLSLGKRWDDRDYPLFFGGGGSYEFGSDNAAISRWILWIKGGVSF